MSEYPEIARGLGKLTPDLWRRLMNALAWVEQVGPELQTRRPDRKGGRAASVRQVLLYRVLDVSTILLDRRWSYGWEQMMLDGVQFVPVPDAPGHLDDGFGRALNTEEANNGTFAHGYGIQTSTAQGTVEPLPLAVGSVVPGVLMRDGTGDDAVQRPVLMPATNPLAIVCQETP